MGKGYPRQHPSNLAYISIPPFPIPIPTPRAHTQSSILLTTPNFKSQAPKPFSQCQCLTHLYGRLRTASVSWPPSSWPM